MRKKADQLSSWKCWVNNIKCIKVKINNVINVAWPLGRCIVKNHLRRDNQLNSFYIDETWNKDKGGSEREKTGRPRHSELARNVRKMLAVRGSWESLVSGLSQTSMRVDEGLSLVPLRNRDRANSMSNSLSHFHIIFSRPVPCPVMRKANLQEDDILTERTMRSKNIQMNSDGHAPIYTCITCGEMIWKQISSKLIKCFVKKKFLKFFNKDFEKTMNI